MKLIQMAKVREGRYLKNYELTYENKAGKEKVYESEQSRRAGGKGDRFVHCCHLRR